MLIVISVCIRVSRDTEARMSELPHVVLWAWERPEDLRTLTPDVGVAYLAATFRIVGDRVITLPRMQPLMVRKNVPLISVFRIEVDERKRTELTDKCARQLCKKICRFANVPRTQATQIDFDALLDERDFYSILLTYLRASLPASHPISITALVSWCTCDNWMKKLPIDESVPMFFSMGPETHNILAGVDMGRRFMDTRCDQSLGISLDEPAVNSMVVPHALRHKRKEPIRIYIFSKMTWREDSIRRAIQISSGQSLNSLRLQDHSVVQNRLVTNSLKQ